MTKTILLLTVIAILFSCKNESGSKPLNPIRDTTATLAVYMGYQLKAVHWGEIQRITVDSLAWVKKDSTNQIKKWTKISYYYGVAPVLVDSAFAVTFNVPKLDSAGKPRVEYINLVLDAQYVRDGVTDLDSARNELKRLYMVDTAAKK